MPILSPDSPSQAPFIPPEITEAIGDQLGEKMTPELLASLGEKLKPLGYSVRHVSRGEAITLEYRVNRLTFYTDNDGEVSSMRLG